MSIRDDELFIHKILDSKPQDNGDIWEKVCVRCLPSRWGVLSVSLV